MEGYHIQSLRKTQAELKKQINSLEIQEADLLTPERLRKLAERMGLQDPARLDTCNTWRESRTRRATASRAASIVGESH